MTTFPRLAPAVNDTEAHPHMVTLLELDWAQQAIDEGRPEAVEEHVRDIIAGVREGEDEYRPIAFSLLAVSYGYRGMHAEASEALGSSNLPADLQHEVLRLAAEVEAHGWQQNALAAFADEDYDAAARILARVALLPGVNTSDDFLRIHYDLGVVYARAGDAERAAAHLAAAGRHGDLQSLLVQPEQGTEGGDLVAEGDALLDAGHYEEALRKYAESTVHGGTPVESMPSVHLRMAKAAALLGNEDLAMQHAQAANRYLGSIDELISLELPPMPDYNP